MKSEKHSLLGSIALIVIAILCIPLMCFTLGGGSSTSTGWTISPRMGSNGKYLGESVIFEVTGKVSAAYVNIGDVYNTDEDGNINFMVDFRSSSQSIEEDDYMQALRKHFSINAGESRNYGWVKLGDLTTLGEKYIKLTTGQSFELKEVAFVDKDGKQLPTKCYGGYVWKGASRYFTTAAQDNLQSFSLTADEQNSFGISGVNALTYKEAEMLGAISNFISGKGYHVSKTSGPLGVELLSLGVLIFGENSFGLRIIPFIFFVATIYLLYFFAKKIFGGHLYATICAIAFLLSGLGLSLGGIGLSYSPALFFAVASLWFMHRLWCTGISSKVHTWSKNLLMATLFLALAVLCDLTAIILLPMLLVGYWVLFARAVKGFKVAYDSASGLDKEYARERLSKTIGYGILAFILCFLFLPLVLNLLSYLVAYPSYAGYYKTYNPFVVIAKNIADLYTSNQSGYFFGWVVGLGSQKLSSFSGEFYITANKAFTVLSTISVIALGVVYLLNHKKKLTNGEILVAFKDCSKSILFLLLSFVACYLSMLIFVGKNEYHSFAYLSVISVLVVTCMARLLKGNLKNKTNKAVVIVLSTIVVLFFAAQFVCFTQIAINPTVAKYLYGWTL